MNLYEYQAKNLFLQFGLPVLNHRVCSDISEVKNYVADLKTNPPWIVKCQIRSGGRGKSGGVLLVSSIEEVCVFVDKWIGRPLITNQTTIDGEIVNSVLIEPSVNILHELYVSILINRDLSQIVFMASNKGGMNIENLISECPDLLYTHIIDPVYTDVHPYEGRIIARKLGLKGIQILQFAKIYINIIHMFMKKDLMLVEINPLVITDSNQLICLDAKITVDHNALFRQSKLLDLYLETGKINALPVSDPSNISYVSLDGNIGCMVNGAGLAMATMDLMKSLGGFPANFLDIGGDANSDYIVSALKMLFKNMQIKAVFINIFGGIVCCDLIANSIMTALSERVINIPIVVRLAGNNAKLGSNKLINSHYDIIVINDLVGAIQKVIKLVK